MAVVALRALGLGDFLTGVPALRALASAYPDEELVLCAPAAVSPLAALTGAVDRVVGVGELQPLPASVHGASLLVNLHGRGPQSHGLALAASPQRFVAFAHADVPESHGMPEWRADEHEVERWCRLLTESGAPADPADMDLPAPEVDVADEVRGATVIHPGAASEARRWPVERFAAVARAERAAGRRVAVTGGREEVSLAQAVGGDVVLAGRTSLDELAAVIAAADRVVCGDTGVAHLATAMRTPSVVLFGPTSPAHWGPPPDRPWHHVIWRGRTGDPHASEPHEGLLAIGVEEVLWALDELPAVPAPAAAS